MTQGMAQPTNISIPAKFAFRPYRAHWVYCSAEIIGWQEEPQSRLLIGPTPLALGRERVLVRVYVPTPAPKRSGLRWMWE